MEVTGQGFLSRLAKIHSEHPGGYSLSRNRRAAASVSGIFRRAFMDLPLKTLRKPNLAPRSGASLTSSGFSESTSPIRSPVSRISNAISRTG